MKQHNLMRVGGILLVGTLVTSCFVGGTFAKYVSEGEGTDLARVAKWGVEVDVKGGGFEETYGKDDPEAKIYDDTVISGGAVEVQYMLGGEPSGDPVEVSNVIAPGTKGQFGGVTITGKPEVAVHVQTTATVELSGWNVGEDGEFYCPLKFTIGGKTINGLDYSKNTAGGESSFENAIKKAIQDATTQYVEAGTDLGKLDNNDVVYKWEWPFENSTGTAANQSDELDTILGKNAAGDDSAKIPAVRITVETRVTQVN